MIFEENLESIDKADRQKIIDYITKEDNGWSLIAASNDDYFRSKVDRVIELEEGSIVSVSTNKSK